MAIRLYMDVHVPMAITRQLRLRKVDVATATEDGTNRLLDAALLEHATTQGRVVFTHDIRFKALAENWIRESRHFAGLIYGHAEGASIGHYVKDLDLIAKACEPEE
jgi:hypothetical protein